MYCRNCGALVNDKAEICVKCGCRPLNGTEYCQECGAKTSEKQEMCITCGCRLRTSTGSSVGILESINSAVNGNADSEGECIDFSDLPLYYQREFQKIYSSGETYKGKFNIWGFLFGFIWALTKGCWLAAVIAFIISIITSGIGGIIYWFIFGFRGTYMYYCSFVKHKQIVV